MAIIPIHIVDAFADRPFTGNPAAIIPNAASLSEEEMLHIAEELSMEAGFVVPPEAREADVKIRFFTRRREASFSGHVVAAAFVSLADRGFFKPTPDGLQLHLETPAGVLPVLLSSDETGATRVVFEVPQPRFGEPISATEVASVLGLPAETVQLDDQGPQRVSCGFDQIVVPICDREAVRGNFRDIEAIQRLCDLRGVGGIVLFCPETYDSAADFHCRFFFPSDQYYEEVASGTSIGAIAAYVVEHGIIPATDTVRLVTEQGHSLGRPTRAEALVHTLNERITHVEVVGTGAVVMRGSFQFARQAKQATV